MKNFILPLIALFFSFATNAQKTGFGENKIVLIGTVGEGSTTFNSDEDETSFTWNQRFGYFFNQNIHVGLGFEFGSEDKYALTAYSRYYITPQKQFSLFAGADLKYLTNTKEGSETKGIDFSLYPGITYFITERLALESSLGLMNFSTIHDKNDKSNKTNSFNVNMNLKSLNIGLICTF